MRKVIMTKEFIDGYKYCLRTTQNIMKTALERNDNGTAMGVVDAFNELIHGLYKQSNEVQELNDEFDELKVPAKPQPNNVTREEFISAITSNAPNNFTIIIGGLNKKGGM